MPGDREPQSRERRQVGRTQVREALGPPPEVTPRHAQVLEDVGAEQRLGGGRADHAHAMTRGVGARDRFVDRRDQPRAVGSRGRADQDGRGALIGGDERPREQADRLDVAAHFRDCLGRAREGLEQAAVRERPRAEAPAGLGGEAAHVRRVQIRMRRQLRGEVVDQLERARVPDRARARGVDHDHDRIADPERAPDLTVDADRRRVLRNQRVAVGAEPELRDPGAAAAVTRIAITIVAIGWRTDQRWSRIAAC